MGELFNQDLELIVQGLFFIVAFADHCFLQLDGSSNLL